MNQFEFSEYKKDNIKFDISYFLIIDFQVN